MYIQKTFPCTQKIRLPSLQQKERKKKKCITLPLSDLTFSLIISYSPLMKLNTYCIVRLEDVQTGRFTVSE